MKMLKLEKLTAESFKDFGRVITTEGNTPESTPGVYDWYPGLSTVDNATSVSINMLTVMERECVSQKFERHENTTETLIPITGGVVVTCVPAGEVKMDRVRAFFVPVGKGVCFEKNVWHFAPHPVGGNATCIVVFRNGTSSDDMIFAELPEPVGVEL